MGIWSCSCEWAIVAIVAFAGVAACSPSSPPASADETTRLKTDNAKLAAKVDALTRRLKESETKSDAATTNAARSKAITLGALRQHALLGALGLPLGNVVEIQATIIAGSDLHTKQDEGSYLLRVTEVSGRSLPGTPTMEFSVPSFSQVKLANNDFGLYELKTGKKAGRLDSDQVAKLEQGYVGKHERLEVYETGGYSGIPGNMPAGIPVWQDHGWGFSTSLVVLKQE